MSNHSFISGGVPAYVHLENDAGNRVQCKIVFKKKNDQTRHLKSASILLKFSDPSNQGVGDEAIALTYDANSLASGRQQGNKTPLQPEEYAILGRHSSSFVKCLTLTTRQRCKVLYHRSYDNSGELKQALNDRYSKIIQFVESSTVCVLFDHNWVHKNEQEAFKAFCLNPELFAAYLVNLSSTGNFREFDRGIAHDAQLPSYTNTVRSPIEPTAVPGTPPLYTTSQEQLQLHECSPTVEATTVEDMNTPPVYTTPYTLHDHKATAVEVPITQGRLQEESKAGNISFCPDSYAPKFHDLVDNAIKASLPEIMRDILSDLFRCTFQVSSPPDSKLIYPDAFLKNSIRAIFSEELAAEIDGRVADILQGFQDYFDYETHQISLDLDTRFKDSVDNWLEDKMEECRRKTEEVTEEAAEEAAEEAVSNALEDALKDVSKDAREVFRKQFQLEYVEFVKERKHDMSETLQKTSRKRARRSSFEGEGLSKQQKDHVDQRQSEVNKVVVDNQAAAIVYFTEHFPALDVQLSLAIIEAFEDEYAAKSFLLMTVKLKKAWIQQQLKRRRNSLCRPGVDFDQLIADI